MSKERLEEIKELAYKCDARTPGYSMVNQDGFARYFVREHGNWLIEQSEQNKRYREAIERAFKEFKCGDAFNAELILVEALEDESE